LPREKKIKNQNQEQHRENNQKTNARKKPREHTTMLFRKKKIQLTIRYSIKEQNQKT
jgi:hypothetical protein